MSWSVPSLTGLASSAGYCIYRATTPNPRDPALVTQAIVGVSTTTFSDTNAGWAGAGMIPAPTFTAAHRFTSSALGINTTSPAYSLDVFDPLHTTGNTRGAHMSQLNVDSSLGGTGAIDSTGPMRVNCPSCTYDLVVNRTSAPSIGAVFYDGVTFRENSSPTPAPAGGFDVCGGNSTGTHALECSYNNGPFYPVALVNTILTGTNCASGASPAVCGSAAAGGVAVPAGSNSTLVVDTSAVTSTSQIMLQEDETIGTALSVTCNTTLASTAVEPVVTARTGGVSFTITLSGTTSVNPVCLSYVVVN